MISHCLFRVMSKSLLPPKHPIAFIFATIHVQLSVLEDKITGNTTALSFTQLNVQKKKKRWLERASSEQPKTRGQQERAPAVFPAEESSGPPHKPKTKKRCICQLCHDREHGYWFPLEMVYP